MNKNQKDINNWVDEFTPDMLSWTINKISDTENAKDIVQDTFLAVAKNIESFNMQSKPKTWIFSILNNKISDFYRKKYKKVDTLDYESYSHFFTDSGEWKKEKQPTDWGEEKNLLDEFEFIEVLNYCIENLPDKFNSVIKMKYYNEKNASEICQELGINSTNMWQIMHRAKLRLRECLNNNWFNN